MTLIDRVATRPEEGFASAHLMKNPCPAVLASRCTRRAGPCSAGEAAFVGRTLEVGILLIAEMNVILYGTQIRPRQYHQQ